jgi:hypothetical protein
MPEPRLVSGEEMASGARNRRVRRNPVKSPVEVALMKTGQHYAFFVEYLANKIGHVLHRCKAYRLPPGIRHRFLYPAVLIRNQGVQRFVHAKRRVQKKPYARIGYCRVKFLWNASYGSNASRG